MNDLNSVSCLYTAYWKVLYFFFQFQLTPTYVLDIQEIIKFEIQSKTKINYSLHVAPLFWFTKHEH